MLGWIFKKKGPTPGPAAAVARKNPPPPAAPPAPAVDWEARLAQARGDDKALLALARSAGVPLPSKLAAIEALAGEAALKLAEREFRSHDRRVHQLAKRRLLAQVAQRQAREQAAHLIAAARALAAEADVAANRSVELDHAWQALDSSAIEPAQHEAFAALSAQLAGQLRERGERERQHKRWQQDAEQALQQLQAACAEAAAGTQERITLAAAVSAVNGALQSPPPDSLAGVAATLRQALQMAAALDARLAVLDRLLAGPAADAAAAPAAPETTHAPQTSDTTETPETPAQPQAPIAADAMVDAGAPTQEAGVAAAPADDPQRAWQALPPLPEAHLEALLQARHARWQQARVQARQERQSQGREQARERQRARQSELGAALADRVAQAEAALDAGQLAEAERQLSAIDDEGQTAAADALQVRIAAAQARLAQLRGWQHWAGGRAREELVLQAEALAAATVAAGNGDEAGAADADVARLSVRQRADVITTLRERWKEIDRLGGAGGRALWPRFDAALKAAHEPVAAHVAAQRAARESNLAARLQLIEGLEATAAPVAPEDLGAESGAVPADPHTLAGALSRFHIEWRKLGPLEHTVPHAARAALLQRMEAAVARVDAPLQAARAQARVEREVLVARARALAADAPGRGRDLPGDVRALQAEWQRHAKALPLARADEQALWADFKAATDAAFAAREAAYSAREAEFQAHAAEREALIERLRVRADDSAAVQRQTLAEVDAAWQRCGPAPRARAAALDAAYRDARDALQQWLDQAAQRAWQAGCDALDAKLALCLAHEHSAAADGYAPTVAGAWQALPALPAPLEDTLRRRAGLLPARADAAAPPADELLLQIETAWGLPTPPAYEEARRTRKLLAMKAALEGHRSEVPAAPRPDDALALLLGRSGLDGSQQARLAAILDARRRRGPQRPA